MIKLSLRSIN